MNIRDMYKTKKHLFSFEIFPPKVATAFEKVSGVVDELTILRPDFISVTYGAGGSVKDNRTVELCKIVKNSNQSEPMAHLTCVGSSREEISDLLDQLEAIGVTNVLALRGDKNPNVTKEGDFRYASELTEYIKTVKPHFNVMGACYPAGHCESASQKEDIINLKRKVDAGASGLITQMFFDNEEFYRFRDLAQVAGIEVPIEVGIMPITNSRQIERVISLSSATMPARLSKLLSRYGQNDKAMFDAGVAYATEQIIELLSADVDGVHLYTMNNPLVAKKISDGISGLIGESR